MYNKSKETQWVNGILQSEVAAGCEWTWDKPLYVTYDGGCCNSKRRIDLWTLVGNVVMAIEIDENQHKYYKTDYELNRYQDLVMDFCGRFVFLRINPDSYLQKGVRRNPAFEIRLPLVEKRIEELLTTLGDFNDSDDMVQIHHMFYDT